MFKIWIFLYMSVVILHTGLASYRTPPRKLGGAARDFVEGTALMAGGVRDIVKGGVVIVGGRKIADGAQSLVDRGVKNTFDTLTYIANGGERGLRKKRRIPSSFDSRYSQNSRRDSSRDYHRPLSRSGRRKRRKEREPSFISSTSDSYRSTSSRSNRKRYDQRADDRRWRRTNTSSDYQRSPERPFKPKYQKHGFQEMY